MIKTFIGTVISTKMTKTVVVSIERKFRHAKYHKVITRHKKFKARNNDLKLAVNDLVKIKETRPISKDTKFIVVEKVSKV